MLLLEDVCILVWDWFGAWWTLNQWRRWVNYLWIEVNQLTTQLQKFACSACVIIGATSKTWTQILDPDPGSGPWTLDPDLEKPGPWKTWETAGYEKMIRRSRIITYYHWKSAKKRLVGKPSEKVVTEAF